MALGTFKIILIVLVIMVAIGQFLLYRNDESQIGLIWNTVIGIIISYLIYTSLPSNEIIQKILALAWGIIALIALVLGLRNKKRLMLSKIMFTISVVGGMIHLLT